MNVKLPMCLLNWIDKDKLDWRILSRNPNAIDLLTANQYKIDWYNLSSNPCAIDLLKANKDKIDWFQLSVNPCAMDLLTANQDKIIWPCLSGNPNIFTYNYDKMRENCLLFKEDLMKERFHPRNLYKFSSWGFEGIDEEEEE